MDSLYTEDDEDLTMVDDNEVEESFQFNRSPIFEPEESQHYEGTEFNEELFLRHICNYPAIYNPIYKGYSNKMLKMKAWENISNSMGKTSEFCIRKWKSLREKYHREKQKKDQSFRSGSGASHEKTWPLYSLFEYMFDKVKAKKTTSSMMPSEALEDSEILFHPFNGSKKTSTVVKNKMKENIAGPSAVTSGPSGTPTRTPKRKSVEEDPMVGVLKQIGNSLDNVRSTKTVDKIQQFSNYVVAEIRDLPKDIQEEFMDETIIRLLQIKRKQRKS